MVIGARWGVSDFDVDRSYPCDGLVPAPVIELWRGVGIDAPPERVWQWLGQLRLAPYSYDWIDNLGRRSPRRLRGLADPKPGDAFSAVGGRPVGRVLAVSPGEHLTARIMGAVMSYVVCADGAGSRLLLKIVIADRHWYAKVLALGDWPMARKQLLTLKRLAESTAR